MKITANMITIARIISLPIPCAFLLFGSSAHIWIAFFWLTFLGMTDFVDGYLARKEGPTKIGELLDPVADKIFVAAITLSLIALGHFAWWIGVAILSREFFITGLRSIVAMRNQSIKTSKLAKMKTIFQMGGFGTIFLTLSISKFWLIAFSLFTALCLATVWFIQKFLSQRKKAQYWVIPVMSAFIFVALLGYFFTQKIAVMCQVVVIVALTWASCFDYIVGCYKLFKAKGLVGGDIVTIFWSIAFGCLVVSTVAIFPQTALALLFCLSSELATGAIDNVLSAQEKRRSLKYFKISTVLAFIYFAVVVAKYFGLFLLVPMWVFAILLALVSLILLSISFAKNFYLFKLADN